MKKTKTFHYNILVFVGDDDDLDWTNILSKKISLLYQSTNNKDYKNKIYIYSDFSSSTFNLIICTELRGSSNFKK